MPIKKSLPEDMTKNRLGFVVNKLGRECPYCRVFKKWPEYHADKQAATGHKAVCISCWSADRKESYVSLRKRSFKMTDLSFLKTIQRSSKNSWTLEQAKLLVLAIQKAANSGELDYKKIFAASGSGHSVGGCGVMLQELKRATAKYTTLEDYFANGRPFSQTARKERPAWKAK